MTLIEANQVLLAVDCSDAEAVAAALTGRAQALAEFASTASTDVLNETLASGEGLRKRLEQVQIEIRRELNQLTKLSRGLKSTLDEWQPDRVTCFG